MRISKITFKEKNSSKCKNKSSKSRSISIAEKYHTTKYYNIIIIPSRPGFHFREQVI